MHIAGARPNFMKVAPVLHALDREGQFVQTLLHTGQHYDRNMSDVFFEQLDLPRPDISLGVGSGSHAQQTAQIMIRFEEALVAQRPDILLVYGDVNSTVATALVGSKLGIKIGHVEAGLRSFDRSMPEELNRLVTDQLSDLLFTPSADADENLMREGVPRERIRRIGNVMIDTLVRLLPKARMPKNVSLPAEYALVTLHRPSNVDEPAALSRILAALERIGRKCPIVFPVHPRTRQRIETLGGPRPRNNSILYLDPVGYLEFLALQSRARLVITDSGGVQEETTYLGVPCLTLRENTERPVTVDVGTNMLVGTDPDRLVVETNRILHGNRPAGDIPELWDGQAGRRLATILAAEAERWRASQSSVPARRAA